MKFVVNEWQGDWFGDWRWGDERITVKLDAEVPIEGLEKVLSDRVEFIYKEMFENGKTSFGDGGTVLGMDFPASWGDEDGQGNPAPDDPLTIYLTVWFNPDVPTSFKFSLREMVDDALDLWIVDGKVTPKSADWYRKFADELQGQVDLIRKAIP